MALLRFVCLQLIILQFLSPYFSHTHPIGLFLQHVSHTCASWLLCNIYVVPGTCTRHQVTNGWLITPWQMRGSSLHVAPTPLLMSSILAEQFVLLIPWHQIAWGLIRVKAIGGEESNLKLLNFRCSKCYMSFHESVKRCKGFFFVDWVISNRWLKYRCTMYTLIGSSLRPGMTPKNSTELQPYTLTWLSFHPQNNTLTFWN